MKIRKFIRIIALLLTGLYAGAAIYSLIGAGPAMKLMQPSSYVEFHQKLDFLCGCPYGIVCKNNTGHECVVADYNDTGIIQAGNIFTTVAFLLFFAEIFFTVSVNVPLNEKVQLWDTNNIPVEMGNCTG